MRTVVILVVEWFVLVGLFKFSECDSSNERIKRQFGLSGNSGDGYIRPESPRYQNENSQGYGISTNVRDISSSNHHSNFGIMNNNAPQISQNGPEYRSNGDRRSQDSLSNQPSQSYDGNQPFSLPVDDPIHFIPDYHSSTIQSRPVAQNGNNYYGNSNNQMQRPNLYEINSNANVRRPQPSQDTYQGNVGVTSQSFGQEGYYGNNPGVGRRPPGQSGYPGNAASVSSTVDSFNGNVNADVGRRPQTSPQDSGSFVSNQNANKPLSTISQETYDSYDRSSTNNDNHYNNYNSQNQRPLSSTSKPRYSGSHDSNFDEISTSSTINNNFHRNSSRYNDENNNDEYNTLQNSKPSRRTSSTNSAQNSRDDNFDENKRSTLGSISYEPARPKSSTSRPQNSVSHGSNYDDYPSTTIINDSIKRKVGGYNNDNSKTTQTPRRTISTNHSQNSGDSNDDNNGNGRYTPDSDSFDGNDNYNLQHRKQSRPNSSTSRPRKSGGLNSNSDGNEASSTINENPRGDGDSYTTQNNRTVMNSNGKGGRHSGSSGGKPLTSNSEYTTPQSIHNENFEENSNPTSNRRTTGRVPTISRTTKKTSSSKMGCILPEQPRGGNYELGGCDSPCEKVPGDRVSRNSILTYSCSNGYVQNGSMVSVCLNDSWYMPPSCLRTCPPLESTSVDITCKLRGNTVSCNELVEPGTIALLACKPSYKIPLTDDPAYREITCLKDGLWNRRLFRCLPKCGSAIAHGNTLVVNGFTAKVGVFPWHVGIYEKKSRLVYEQICAGTLINSNLVVSAAHCFYNEATNEVKDVGKYSVAAGKHYRNWKTEENYAQKSDVDTITVADRYMGARGNFAQDIALVRLKSPFELTGLVRPVCLDWDNVLEREHLQAGRNGKVVGWGKTASGESSEELQEINLPFVSFDQCLANVPADFRGYITPDKFCAGYMNGSSLCEGDSGGGLCFVSNGLWYLRGIVSVSPVKDYSCDYNSYTGFTYFSHFRDWVRIAFLES